MAERTDEHLDCVVSGAGVVGLAIARRMALAGREVVILEAEESFGTHTSARNSEVIHAGIYYASGSLKAQLCVPGKQALYRYCAEHDVQHRNIGKVVVACEEAQVPAMHKYMAQGKTNGVDDLRLLSNPELARLEPNVRAAAGFYSPSTGIIDSHGLMLAYLGDAESRGAALALASPVISGAAGADGITLHVGGAETMNIRCRTVINAAGLKAPAVASSIRGIPARGRQVFVAGQVGWDGSGQFRSARLCDQVRQALENIVAILAEAGGRPEHGVRLTWSNTECGWDNG